MLTLDEGTTLVKTARNAIESCLEGKTLPLKPKPDPKLATPQGVFVTLLDSSSERALRGCIGNPLPHRPLLEHVSLMAIEAATSDPRFPPLSLKELRSSVVVEVSALTVPEVIQARKPLDYTSSIVIGRDGLIVEGLGHRGLLLPQVAVEEDFDPEEFLSQCCLKAGLLPDEWLSGRVKVCKFQAQVFSEERPNGQVHERNLTETQQQRH